MSQCQQQETGTENITLVHSLYGFKHYEHGDKDEEDAV